LSFSNIGRQLNLNLCVRLIENKRKVEAKLPYTVFTFLDMFHDKIKKRENPAG